MLSICGEAFALKVIDLCLASQSLKFENSEGVFSMISYRLSSTCFSLNEGLYCSILESVKKLNKCWGELD